MQEKKAPLYLTQEGYEEYLKEIEDIRKKLENNGKSKSEAYTSAVGDGWHDNFEFEDAKREEFKIMGELKEKMEGLSRIIIINKSDNEELIDINDYVTVDMIFSEDDIEEFTFKLVGSSSPVHNGEIPEVSINSPLGKTVYQKSVGYNGQYEVNKFVTSIVIKDFTKELENQQSKEKTMRGN